LLSTDQTAVVTATLRGRLFTATVSLVSGQTDISSLSCHPDYSRTATLRCTVILDKEAPEGGTKVKVQSDNARLNVPAEIGIFGGTKSTQFFATLTAPHQEGQAHITASVRSSTQTLWLSIGGIRPIGLTCTPKSIQAGDSFKCTVNLNTPTFPLVADLAVSSDNADLMTPKSMMTRPGQVQLAFEVFSAPQSKQRMSTVAVRFGEATVSDDVLVTSAGPTLSLPGPQVSVWEEEMAFTVSAFDPAGLPVVLSASGLPQGAVFDPVTGEFSWKPSRAVHAVVARGEPVVPRTLDRARYVVVFAASNSANTTTTGTVAIQVDSGIPVVTGLRNAASQSAETVCSPGSIASMFGRWLSSGEVARDSLGGSILLGGTRVNVNGKYVPVLYASSEHIDFLCPDVDSGTVVDISAEVNEKASNHVQTTVQPVALGLFSLDGSGRGQGVVTLMGTSLLATNRTYKGDGQPAEPSDSIAILGTGIDLAVSGPDLRARIGDLYVAAAVVAAPGFAGAFEAQLELPRGVLLSEAVPIVFEAILPNGKIVESNSITIAIEPARP
jgi:uncharacterized protein (TIGR03437 family)